MTDDAKSLLLQLVEKELIEYGSKKVNDDEKRSVSAWTTVYIPAGTTSDVEINNLIADAVEKMQQCWLKENLVFAAIAKFKDWSFFLAPRWVPDKDVVAVKMWLEIEVETVKKPAEAEKAAT